MELGMYACADSNYPQIRVGKFVICRQDESHVWIQKNDDEGSSFPDDLVEKAIEEFFRANF